MSALAPLPPFLVFYAAALLAGFTRGTLRSLILLAAPLLGGLCVYGLGSGALLRFEFLDYTLVPLHVDALSRVFGYLFVTAGARSRKKHRRHWRYAARRFSGVITSYSIHYTKLYD